MRRELGVFATAAPLLLSMFTGQVAFAQKHGGVLKMSHFDSPASMSYPWVGSVKDSNRTGTAAAYATTSRVVKADGSRPKQTDLITDKGQFR